MVSILILLSSTLAWADDCRIGNGGKAEKSRSSALLFAHRCFLKDVPIKVPSPINTIPDIIIPSHIVVPRCSGKKFLTKRQDFPSFYSLLCDLNMLLL